MFTVFVYSARLVHDTQKDRYKYRYFVHIDILAVICAYRTKNIEYVIEFM